MHARMTIKGQVIMASDAPPGRYSKPGGFSVNISVTDPKEADRIFNALSEGGTVHMPIGETFWALRFAMFADRFGIPWMVNCEKTAEKAA
jgi:PhnB protein